jgi:hypothetical protein
MRMIVTQCLCPPIPIRTYDWIAYRDGEEERREYGYGRTEEEAVEELIALWPEEAET